ncbi:hypothetical protein ACS0TY_034736 [Phlomoides rotata]
MSRVVRGDEEEDVLELGDGGTTIPVKVRSDPVCLVGKLCTDKTVNSFALSEVMIKAFRSKGKLNARDWGHGLWIFSFELEEDRAWVIRNQPWHFDNVLFAIKPLYGKEQPSSIQFTTTAFWIRVYDLPLLCQTTDSLVSIASKIGTLVAYEKHDPIEPVEFVRVKVEVDITRPLRNGLSVRLTGEVLWIPIKYESMPSFCYCCGVIGHYFKTCKFYDRDEDLEPSALSFGPMLKAHIVRRPKGGRVEIIYMDDGRRQPSQGGEFGNFGGRVSNINEDKLMVGG